MNNIAITFENKKNNVLSIYFTAGYPKLTDTIKILEILQDAGADMVEIGMPFSDPLADGPVIQNSSTVALQNGMSIQELFDQLHGMRTKITMPVILMGYYNPVFKYGIENFCKSAAKVGIDGLILPDLPIEEYLANKSIFDKYGLCNVLLITPQTTDERIKQIDNIASGFVYAVSSYATTGSGKALNLSAKYFERLKSTAFKNPVMVGFGIKDKATFDNACKYANGAIIGTEFIKLLEKYGTDKAKITEFIKSVKGNDQ